jgi:hypothetical protein
MRGGLSDRHHDVAHGDTAQVPEVRQDGVPGGPVEGGWDCVPQGLLPVQPLQRDAQGHSLCMVWCISGTLVCVCRSSHRLSGRFGCHDPGAVFALSL